MNPKGKKFIALFLILSFLAINCITFKLPGRKVRQGTSTESKQDIISLSEVEALKPGTRIVVILKTGVLVSGKYAGLSLVPAEEYAESYAKSREQNKEEIMLPELGETVTVIRETGKQYEVEFLGFDYGTILLRFEKMGKTRSSKENIRKISLLIKNIVDSRGNIIELETVRKLISEGKIPLISSGIIAKSKVGPTQINWEDIYQIEVKKKKKGMPFGARLAIVAAAVGLIYIVIDDTIKDLSKKMDESCSMGAAYDSPTHHHVMILQDFRDTYLMPSELGCKLVNLYYKYSPFFAHFIAKHKALKVMVRIGLLPMIAFSYSMVHFGPIITAVMIILILVLSVFLISFFQRKLRRIAAGQL